MSLYVADRINNIERKLNIDELVLYVQTLSYKYIEKYKRKPKFIKIPLWLFILMLEYQSYILGVEKRENEQLKFMEMLVCETESIDEIDEIEVF